MQAHSKQTSFVGMAVLPRRHQYLLRNLENFKQFIGNNLLDLLKACIQRTRIVGCALSLSILAFMLFNFPQFFHICYSLLLSREIVSIRMLKGGAIGAKPDSLPASSDS
jgi:hypothetical protein